MQKNERIFNNMKRKVVIKGIFNDYFTGYKDKESSVSMIVDMDNCECHRYHSALHSLYPQSKCSICKLIDRYGAVDLEEK